MVLVLLGGGGVGCQDAARLAKLSASERTQREAHRRLGRRDGRRATWCLAFVGLGLLECAQAVDRVHVGGDLPGAHTATAFLWRLGVAFLGGRRPSRSTSRSTPGPVARIARAKRTPSSS